MHPWGFGVPFPRILALKHLLRSSSSDPIGFHLKAPLGHMLFAQRHGAHSCIAASCVSHGRMTLIFGDVWDRIQGFADANAPELFWSSWYSVSTTLVFPWAHPASWVHRH